MGILSLDVPKFPASVLAVMPLIEPWSGPLQPRRRRDLVRAAGRAEEILEILGRPAVTGSLAKLPGSVFDPQLLTDLAVYLGAATGLAEHWSDMSDVMRWRTLPKELRDRAWKLLRRMVGVARHTLGEVDEAVAILRSAGRAHSFAEIARGLRKVSAIYTTYAADVVRDGQNFRAADAAEALATAEEIERVLRGVVVNEMDRIADRVWTRLVEAYRKILAAVRLVCDEATFEQLPVRINFAPIKRRVQKSEVAATPEASVLPSGPSVPQTIRVVPETPAVPATPVTAAAA